MRQDARRRGNKITAMMYFRENYLGYSPRALCSEEASLRCMEAGRPSFLLPIVPCVFATFRLVLCYKNTQQEYPASSSLSLAWLLAFTSSFAWLVCRVVGLFAGAYKTNQLLD